MRTTRTTTLLNCLVVAALFLFGACTAGPPPPLPDRDPQHDEAEPVHGAAEPDEHAHGEEETSDLDRPVTELFAATCEHEVKTYECDECRYEVGVVKADAELLTGGLIGTAKVERRAVSAPLALTGEVRFDQRRVFHVSTQAEGTIRAVHVTLGDKVEEGQPLIEIESVAVGEAESEYLEARGMLTLTERNHDRLAALRREGIVSERELLGAKQALDAAQIRVDATLGKLTRLGMSLSAARQLTVARSNGRLVLRSPATGTVLTMHAVGGEIARSETSLVTVGDNSAMWVWADLYERDVAVVTREQAKQALKALIEVKAYPGQEFEGTVDLVSPSMTESSRTVKVRIAAANPAGKLLAGMFATVNVFLPSERHSLATAKQAVLEDEGRSFVFVHQEGDYFVRRPVEVGVAFEGYVEITDGLSEGDIVVTEGAFLLKSDVLRSKMGAGCAD